MKKEVYGYKLKDSKLESSCIDGTVYYSDKWIFFFDKLDISKYKDKIKYKLFSYDDFVSETYKQKEMKKVGNTKVITTTIKDVEETVSKEEIVEEEKNKPKTKVKKKANKIGE